MKDLRQFRRIHFVGIGGAGMSAIASVLLRRGFQVSGSDLSDTIVTQRLAHQGAVIHRGHVAANIEGADLVVTSTAIRKENPERLAAETAGIPIWRRARVLAQIMLEGKGLAVSGTHGKTTTTSMMGLAMARSGLDPTVLVGGDVEAFGGNARIGEGEWIVAEADESDASMLEMQPDGIIITNIEADHLDFYRDLAHVIETFKTFIGGMRPGGVVVGCIDSPPVAQLLKETSCNKLTYSLHDGSADMVARDIRCIARDGAIRFTPVFRGEHLLPVRLRVPGRHNVANAMSVLLMGLEAGCNYEKMAAALGEYNGAKRRFQIKGISHGITVIDDYAHHPTEIRATLAAARDRLRRRKASRIVSIFQPHRYSRTVSFAAEFGQAFREADVVVITDVYGAGEDPIEGVTGESIVTHALNSGHPEVHYVPRGADVVDFITPRLREGDVVFTLGAGDVWRVGEGILDELEGSSTSNLGKATSAVPV